MHQLTRHKNKVFHINCKKLRKKVQSRVFLCIFRSRLSSSPCFSADSIYRPVVSGPPHTSFYPSYYHSASTGFPSTYNTTSAASSTSYNTGRSDSPPPSAQILGEYFNAGMSYYSVTNWSVVFTASFSNGCSNGLNQLVVQVGTAPDIIFLITYQRRLKKR